MGIKEVVKQLQSILDNFQIEVLDFTRKLKGAAVSGVPGKTLLQFVGTIPIASR